MNQPGPTPRTAPRLRWLRPAVTTACLVWAVSALAQAGVSQAVHYFDGAVQRTITPEPRWEALITPAAAPDAAQAREAGSSAHRPAQVTLRPAGAGSARAIDPPGSVRSPTWREGTSPAGRLMALPGGVIVQLPAGWSDADVRAWTESRQLQIAQRLELPGRWYLVASPPGTASLELANRLHLSGEVLSASPNWWKHTTQR